MPNGERIVHFTVTIVCDLSRVAIVTEKLMISPPAPQLLPQVIGASTSCESHHSRFFVDKDIGDPWTYIYIYISLGNSHAGFRLFRKRQEFVRGIYMFFVNASPEVKFIKLCALEDTRLVRNPAL